MMPCFPTYLGCSPAGCYWLKESKFGFLDSVDESNEKVLVTTNEQGTLKLFLINMSHPPILFSNMNFMQASVKEQLQQTNRLSHSTQELVLNNLKTGTFKHALPTLQG